MSCVAEEAEGQKRRGERKGKGVLRGVLTQGSVGSALDLTDLSPEVWTSPSLSFWSVNRMSENTLVVVHWSNQVLTASHLMRDTEVGNGLRRHLLGGKASTLREWPETTRKQGSKPEGLSRPFQGLDHEHIGKMYDIFKWVFVKNYPNSEVRKICRGTKLVGTPGSPWLCCPWDGMRVL